MAGHWLDPLREQLDHAVAPVEFFFRDDDVGWRDERLFALLRCFRRVGQPVDLALIPTGPTGLTRGVARALVSLASSGEAVIGLHQHGLAHANHETAGNKSEFGPARDRAAQMADIAAGRDRLAELLDEPPQPIFTPPWNLCTPATGDCLVELGFRALSRGSDGVPLALPDLVELPVAVDWSYGAAGPTRLAPSDVATQTATAAGVPGPVGILLHHAVMDVDELALVDELLDLIATHDAAIGRPMLALVDAVGITR